jgi:hypothetical protein
MILRHSEMQPRAFSACLFVMIQSSIAYMQINTRKTGGKTGVMAMAYSPSTQQTISLYKHFLVTTNYKLHVFNSFDKILY